MAQVPIKNYGKTPAYEISVSMNMECGDALPADAPERAAGPMGHLGPGADLTVVTELGRPLTVPELNAITRRDRHLFVYGRIRYVDAFGRERCTKFGLETGKTSEAEQTSLASTGREWNTTDDDISALAKPEARSWLNRFALAVSLLTRGAR